MIVIPPAFRSAAETDALARRLEPIFGHDLAEQRPVVMQQLSALRAFDASSRLRHLAGIPTLVVSAAHDPIAPPRFGRALASAIGGAQHIEYADASHGLPIQYADRVNNVLRELREHICAVERPEKTRIEYRHIARR